MVWLLLIVGLILLMVVYLLTAPVVFEVDSERSLFRVRFHRLASAKIRLADSSIFLDLNIVGWKMPMDLLRPKAETGKARQMTPEKPPRKKSRHIPFRKIRAVIRSFRIKKCEMIIDTGDMPLNGMLFPVCYWLSLRSGKTFGMSFTGENVIQLEIQNSMGRMLSAYIRA